MSLRHRPHRGKSRVWHRPVAALAAAGALFLTGCGAAASADPAPTSGSAGSDVDLGPVWLNTGPFELTLRVPQTMHLIEVTDAKPGEWSGCQAAKARLISPGQFYIWALPADCTVDESRAAEKPGNGYHGIYRSIDDVLAPKNVQTVEKPGATFTIFQQDYYECTNACNDYVESVAIVTLKNPPDPAFPTLLIVAARGEIPHEVFVQMMNELMVSA